MDALEINASGGITRTLEETSSPGRSEFLKMYGGLSQLKCQARDYAMRRGWNVPPTPAARLAVTRTMMDPPSVARLATPGGITAFPKDQPGKVTITQEQYDEYNRLRQEIPGGAQRNSGRGDRGSQVEVGRGGHSRGSLSERFRGTGDQGDRGTQVVRRGGRGGNSRECGGPGGMDRDGQGSQAAGSGLRGGSGGDRAGLGSLARRGDSRGSGTGQMWSRGEKDRIYRDAREVINNRKQRIFTEDEKEQMRSLGGSCSRCRGDHGVWECSYKKEELYCSYPPCFDKRGHTIGACHDIMKRCRLDICQDQLISLKRITNSKYIAFHLISL